MTGKAICQSFTQAHYFGGLLAVMCAVLLLGGAAFADASLPQHGRDEEAIRLLRSLSARLSQLNALAFEARIVSERTLTAGTRKDEAICRAVLQRPNRLRMRYEVPGEGLTLVLNGSEGIMALDSTQSYRKISGGGNPGDYAGWLTQQPAIRRVLSEDPLAGWLDHVLQIQAVTEQTPEGTLMRFDLQFQHTSVSLWIDPEQGLPRRLSADTSRSGGRAPGSELATVTWTGWETAPEVADSVFDVTPPAGFQESHVFAGPPDLSRSDLVGMEMPPVTLELCTGGKLDFGGFRGNQALVLDFWATWCRPCRYAIDQIKRLAEEFKKNPSVAFVTVNLMEPPETVRPWKQRQQLTLPVALDRDGRLADQLRVEALPTTIVVGQDGIIRYLKTGYSRGFEQELKKVITDLLAGQLPEAPEHSASAAEQLRWRMDMDRDAYCSVFVRY